MGIQLGWDDLLIQDLRIEDCRKWLGQWSGLVSDRMVPLSMSKFGDWFLRLPDGSTCELSVLEGTYSKIASTPDEFTALMNCQEWQEDHLLSLLVYQLHDRQTIPVKGQCYGFVPHPRLSGRIDANQAVIMEVGAWQAICAATIALKAGTTLRGR